MGREKKELIPSLIQFYYAHYSRNFNTSLLNDSCGIFHLLPTGGKFSFVNRDLIFLYFCLFLSLDPLLSPSVSTCYFSCFIPFSSFFLHFSLFFRYGANLTLLCHFLSSWPPLISCLASSIQIRNFLV